MNPIPFSPKKIAVIAKNAFREAVRDRILYNLVVFVLLITASAIFLGELTAGQEAKVIVDLGLSAMLIFGAFIAIFVGVGLVWKEIEKRTVYSIFSKPVFRAEFIIGKYLGLCLTLLVNVVLMGVGVTLAIVYVGGSQLIPGVWSAVVLIYLELIVLTAVAIMFSSFSTPALSALLTFLVFVIGHFSSALKMVAADMGSASARYFFTLIYYLFPNLSHFSFITETANGLGVPSVMMAQAFLLAVVYSVILLSVSVMVFSRRNFK
jgi:ABC-type transport system involved in multi-copper enzyme maturation permease subunit